jgi:DNA-binding CsgD family transcriptional regulator
MYFDRLIERIYDAADEPMEVSAVLRDAGAALSSPIGNALVIANGLPLQNYGHGASADQFQEYSRHWRDHDPRVPISNARFGEIISDVAVLDPTEFERSPIYNEHLLKNEARYTMFITTRCGPDLVLAQAFLRRKQDAAFERSDIEQFARIVPHFARALRLRHVIDSLRGLNDDLLRAVDRFREPLFILSAAGKARSANAAAERVLAERDGLTTMQGILAADRADETRAIAKAVAEAAALADRRSSAVVPIVRITRRRGALSLLFFPLRRRSAFRTTADRSGRVLVLVHDASAVRRLSPPLIAALHGLTATEAELAACLAEGRSLADFAIERGCTEQTARTHMKRVLEKTGTRRQA